MELLPQAARARDAALQELQPGAHAFGAAASPGALYAGEHAGAPRGALATALRDALVDALQSLYGRPAVALSDAAGVDPAHDNAAELRGVGDRSRLVFACSSGKAAVYAFGDGAAALADPAARVPDLTEGCAVQRCWYAWPPAPLPVFPSEIMEGAPHDVLAQQWLEGESIVVGGLYAPPALARRMAFGLRDLAGPSVALAGRAHHRLAIVARYAWAEAVGGAPPRPLVVLSLGLPQLVAPPHAPPSRRLRSLCEADVKAVESSMRGDGDVHLSIAGKSSRAGSGSKSSEAASVHSVLLAAASASTAPVSRAALDATTSTDDSATFFVHEQSYAAHLLWLLQVRELWGGVAVVDYAGEVPGALGSANAPAVWSTWFGGVNLIDSDDDGDDDDDDDDDVTTTTTTDDDSDGDNHSTLLYQQTGCTEVAVELCRRAFCIVPRSLYGRSAGSSSERSTSVGGGDGRLPPRAVFHADGLEDVTLWPVAEDCLSQQEASLPARLARFRRRLAAGAPLDDGGVAERSALLQLLNEQVHCAAVLVERSSPAVLRPPHFQTTEADPWDDIGCAGYAWAPVAASKRLSGLSALLLVRQHNVAVVDGVPCARMRIGCATLHPAVGLTRGIVSFMLGLVARDEDAHAVPALAHTLTEFDSNVPSELLRIWEEGTEKAGLSQLDTISNAPVHELDAVSATPLPTRKQLTRLPLKLEPRTTNDCARALELLVSGHTTSWLSSVFEIKGCQRFRLYAACAIAALQLQPGFSRVVADATGFSPHAPTNDAIDVCPPMSLCDAYGASVAASPICQRSLHELIDIDAISQKFPRAVPSFEACGDYLATPATGALVEVRHSDGLSHVAPFPSTSAAGALRRYRQLTLSGFVHANVRCGVELVTLVVARLRARIMPLLMVKPVPCSCSGVYLMHALACFRRVNELKGLTHAASNGIAGITDAQFARLSDAFRCHFERGSHGFSVSCDANVFRASLVACNFALETSVAMLSTLAMIAPPWTPAELSKGVIDDQLPSFTIPHPREPDEEEDEEDGSEGDDSDSDGDTAPGFSALQRASLRPGSPCMAFLRQWTRMSAQLDSCSQGLIVLLDPAETLPPRVGEVPPWRIYRLVCHQDETADYDPPWSRRAGASGSSVVSCPFAAPVHVAGYDECAATTAAAARTVDELLADIEGPQDTTSAGGGGKKAARGTKKAGAATGGSSAPSTPTAAAASSSRSVLPPPLTPAAATNLAASGSSSSHLVEARRAALAALRAAHAAELAAVPPAAAAAAAAASAATARGAPLRALSEPPQPTAAVPTAAGVASLRARVAALQSAAAAQSARVDGARTALAAVCDEIARMSASLEQSRSGAGGVGAGADDAATVVADVAAVVTSCAVAQISQQASAYAAALEAHVAATLAPLEQRWVEAQRDAAAAAGEGSAHRQLATEWRAAATAKAAAKRLWLVAALAARQARVAALRQQQQLLQQRAQQGALHQQQQQRGGGPGGATADAGAGAAGGAAPARAGGSALGLLGTGPSHEHCS